MIGRNDPCPCGSGKKYKKCCIHKTTISTDEIVDEEIEMILQTFYSTYPKRDDIAPFRELVEKWTTSIGEQFQRELIEAIALDEFFFHVDRTIWTRYIEKQRERAIRPAVQRLLTQWNMPTCLIGHVLETNDRVMVARDYVTAETIHIRLDTDRPIPLHSNFYTFVLPNGRDDEYLAVSTLLFIPRDFEETLTAWSETEGKRESGEARSLSLFTTLVRAGFNGDEWTQFEANVLTKLMQFLRDEQIDAQRLLPVIEDYLAAQQPNARKDVAIAAGAVRFGIEQQLIQYDTTWTDLGETFDVSTSSLAKYAKEMTSFLEHYPSA